MVYLAKRLAVSALLLIGVFTVVFVLVRLTGDPARVYLPVEASEAQVNAMRSRLGLDRPLWEQYLRALGGLARGDLGHSFGYGRPALQVLAGPLLTTLALIGVSMVVSLLLAVPAGVLAALRRGSWVDSLVTSISLLGQGLPSFWWALMLILVFSVQLRWLPAFGTGSWRHLVLPAITLGSFLAGAQARVIRSAVLQTLQMDHVRTAKGKGLPGGTVLFKHVLKSALPSILTLLGLQLGQLVGGAVVTEYVFAYPGMGRLLVYAVQVRDFALTQAFVLVTSAFIVTINLVVDLLVTLIDPRVRLS